MEKNSLVCSRCNESKCMTEFYPSLISKGFKSFIVCKVCWKAKSKEYREANSLMLCEKQKIYQSKTHKNFPEILKYHVLKRRAKKNNWPFVMTKNEFYQWWREKEKKCYYCDSIDPANFNRDFSSGKIIYFTIDRKNNNLPYTIENMCLACQVCNFCKSNIFSENEWREIAQKYIKPKWLLRLDNIVQSNGKE